MGNTGNAPQVANAITAYSQTIKNPDRAAEMDRQAIPVMKHLARSRPDSSARAEWPYPPGAGGTIITPEHQSPRTGDST